MIFVALLILGALLGCVGAGGAGLTITMLTVGFAVPIHTAIAVSLSCMTFTVLSGAISHYREGEVLLKLGAATGAAGIAGALAGTRFAFLIPAKWLSPATAIMLLLTTVLLYLQLFRSHLIADYVARNKRTAAGSVFYIRSCAIGLFTHLIPKHILRYLMISMPLIGGLLLLTH